MSGVSGVGGFRPVGAASARPAARAGAGFSVAAQAETGGAAAVAAPLLTGLLALQEAGGDAAQDGAARQGGFALLAELAALQRDLLAEGPAPGRLARLASLAESAPDAASPALRGVLGEIVLRARVEAARYTKV